MQNGDVVPPDVERETTLGAEDVKKPPIVVIAGPPGSGEVVGKKLAMMMKLLFEDVMADQVVPSGKELDSVEVGMPFSRGRASLDRMLVLPQSRAALMRCASTSHTGGDAKQTVRNYTSQRPIASMNTEPVLFWLSALTVSSPEEPRYTYWLMAKTELTVAASSLVLLSWKTVPG